MEEKYLRRPSIRHLLFGGSITSGSNIWNNILRAKEMTNSREKLSFGNGKDTLFW